MSDSSRSRHYGVTGYRTDQPIFDLSDYLNFEDGFAENLENSVQIVDDDSGGISSMNSESEERGVQMDDGIRIAFRTKSELEVMDDGFKWRKYGKKQVKNSPNPRNYYRCSDGRCPVKKRVQRDRDDPTYVITTYDGVHNHESPCVFYCTPRHDSSSLGSSNPTLMFPNARTFQPAHPSS
ncbi:WRKY transcription factor 71-like [Tasmannia lanceolata]|uniref:WRKY transcription factor 71-like n=1 Tax=Tasmannia lanceolata TaxID=3420 RepID=UPI004063E893